MDSKNFLFTRKFYFTDTPFVNLMKKEFIMYC